MGAPASIVALRDQMIAAAAEVGITMTPILCPHGYARSWRVDGATPFDVVPECEWCYLCDSRDGSAALPLGRDQ